MPRLLPVFVLVAAAFAGDDGWRRIDRGLELTFPADHGAHPDTRIEWWYFTGNLEAADGRRFGFQYTVFRSGIDATPLAPGESPLRLKQVYAGHLALTDVAGQRTRFAERIRRAGTPLALAATDDMDVVLEDWTLRRAADDALTIDAADLAQGFGIALELAPAKPLVLHGEDGYSAKGGAEGNASAYVSWTRLAVTGAVAVDGVELEVTGTAWYDHEFGSSVLGEGVTGWDWFGLHLDDGRDLMLFVLRREGGGIDAASAGTVVAPDGTATPLARADFALAASGPTWTSERSGAVYPARWTLSVPAHGIELTATPLVPDCELATGGSTGVTYWEGPVRLEGSVTGRGYAELTGYSGSMGGRL